MCRICLVYTWLLKISLKNIHTMITLFITWVIYTLSSFVGMWIATTNPDFFKVTKLLWFAVRSPNTAMSVVYLFFTFTEDNISVYSVYNTTRRFAAASIFSIIGITYFTETSSGFEHTGIVIFAVLLGNLCSFIYNTGRADALRSDTLNFLS